MSKIYDNYFHEDRIFEMEDLEKKFFNIFKEETFTYLNYSDIEKVFQKALDYSVEQHWV